MTLVCESKKLIEPVPNRMKLRVPTQMPFTDQPGSVADIMQMSCQGALAAWQAGHGILVVIADWVKLVPKPRLIAPGHHARPRGTAERGRHVPLRKAHAILDNRINVRRGDLGVPLTTQLTVPEVIGQ